MSSNSTPMSPRDSSHAILNQIIEVKGGSERAGQVQMAGVIAESMATERPLLIEGGTGIGKALALDTPILTTVGFVHMGDLTTDHFVYCEDGRARRVSKVFAVRHGRPCYRVTFSDGSWHIADGQHEYNTLSKSDRRRAGVWAGLPDDPWQYSRTHTVDEIRGNLAAGGVSNHHIPLADEVDTSAMAFADEALPVAPYVVGAWLYGAHRFSSERRCVRLPAPNGHQIPGFDQVGVSLYAPQADALSYLESLDANRIPDRYLLASADERRDLLAGIVDACGVSSVPPRSRGQVRILHHDVGLLHSAQTLLATLGLRASLAGASVGARGNRPGYVGFAPLTNPYLHAKNKRAVLAALDDDPAPRATWASRRRAIVSIEPVESVPVRCIEVDSPRHLYLAGPTLVPTHNSIGYIAGALAFSQNYQRATKKRCSTVLAPHTKALQDQLVYDLDLIASSYQPGRADGALTHAPTYTIIKGRSSYLCLRKLHAGDAEAEALDINLATGEVGAPSSTVGEEVQRLHAWAEKTTTGDRAELDAPVSNKAWKSVSSTAQECIGKRCPFAEDCYANLVRDAAGESDIIVVNQAYLATAMKIDGLLPENVKGIIVDEAHELRSTVSDIFGSTVSRPRILQTLKSVKAIEDKSGRGKKALEDIAEVCARFDRFPRLQSGAADRQLPGDPAVRSLFEVIVEHLRGLTAIIESIPATSEDDKASKEFMGREVATLAEDIELILGGNTDTQVVWAEQSSTNEDELVFHAAMFDCSEIIFDRLLKPYRSVVFTSATLSSDPHNFDQVAREHGFGLHGSPWRWQTVPSPFDYEQQGMIYHPDNMPDPSNRTPEGRQAYAEAVGKVAEAAIKAADGRALILCSSRDSVRGVSEYLRSVLDPSRNKLLVQDSESSPKHLAKEFTEDPHSVLVGTRSFWTGISVEGDTCAVTNRGQAALPSAHRPDHRCAHGQGRT